MDLRELEGLSKEILSWRRKYKDIFYIKVDMNKYIFRLLTRGEYFNIYGLQHTVLKNTDDIVLEMCLLYPIYSKDVLDYRLAGEIEYVSKCIVELSGFSRTDTILNDIEEERKKVEILDNQILLLICKAFPHISLNDLDNMNYQTLLRYLVLAEAILDVKLNIEKPKPQDKIDFDKENLNLKGGKTIPLKPHKEEKSVNQN